MLESTFRHLPGVGAKTEGRLWSAGVHSWQALTEGSDLPLSARKVERLKGHVGESVRQLSEGNPHYFCDRLPAGEHWRLFPEFRDTVAYVDIETTGLGAPGDYITTVALYDGKTIRHYVRDRNLEDFADDVAQYRIIVTYNGKCFDVPFIRNALGLPMPHAHIDLRYVLAGLGYRGGLKGCERQLGLDRDDLADVDGYFAVLLWRDYLRKGNTKALDTLLAYNILDVVNLETLMVIAYNERIKATPFGAARRLPTPTPPESPFQADRDTIDRIKRAHGW